LFPISIKIQRRHEQWVCSDFRKKEAKLVEKEETNTRFAKMFLARWDHSANAKAAIDDQKYSIGDEMEEAMHEHKLGVAKRARTATQIMALLLRKAVGFLLYLALQALSYAAIVYLTIRANSLSDKLIATFGSSFLGASIVPAVVRDH
jgi:hypothetical protein